MVGPDGEARLSAAKEGGRAVEPYILTEIKPPLATITINRPNVFNALNSRAWEELADAVNNLPIDGTVQVGILQGSGKHFSSGADLFEIRKMQQEQNADEHPTEVGMNYMRLVIAACDAIQAYPFPFIAKVRGHALGASNVLPHACDIRIGDGTAKTGIPAGRVGIMLPPELIRLMVVNMGEVNTKFIIYSGRIFDARESVRLQQLNYIVDSEYLDAKVQELALSIAEQSPESLITANAGFDLISHNPSFTSEDVDPNRHYAWSVGSNLPEGIGAFREKRKPSWGTISEVVFQALKKRQDTLLNKDSTEQ